MKLLEIYNLYLSVVMQADDALEEYNSGKYTDEEKELGEQHWNGVKLGAETFYKKIQEGFAESK